MQNNFWFLVLFVPCHSLVLSALNFETLKLTLCIPLSLACVHSPYARTWNYGGGGGGGGGGGVH